jgi:hypothetical protein
VRFDTPRLPAWIHPQTAHGVVPGENGSNTVFQTHFFPPITDFRNSGKPEYSAEVEADQAAKTAKTVGTETVTVEAAKATKAVKAVEAVRKALAKTTQPAHEDDVCEAGGRRQTTKAGDEGKRRRQTTKANDEGKRRRASTRAKISDEGRKGSKARELLGRRSEAGNGGNDGKFKCGQSKTRAKLTE